MVQHMDTGLSKQEREREPSGESFLEGMPGSSATFRWQGDRIHYRCIGFGPPVVLVHAPDIGASCIEWRRNMEALGSVYTVYAVDLPGYGLSDIRPRPYTAELYITFLTDFLRLLAGPRAFAAGCLQSASYLVHVAVRTPALLAKLILITPGGISSHQPGTLGGAGFLIRHMPGLASALYGSSTSRYAILEHLQNDVYVDNAHAGPHAVDVRYWVSHREHAEAVERSRAAGLQNVELRNTWQKLRRPSLVVWGRAALAPPLSDGELLVSLNRNAQLAVFDHSALAPHEEEPHKFNQLALSFFGTAAPK